MKITTRPCATLTLAIGLALGTLPKVGLADGLIRDPRIRPDTQLTVSSSDPQLDLAIARSVDYIYDYLVVGPQQYPTTEEAERITKFRDAGVPAVPSLWGSYHGTPTANATGYRENFCLRDVAHQTEGAALLSLNEENIDMLTRFAFDALQDKRVEVSDPNLDPLDPWASARPKSFWQEYWTLWSYNFYGAPYYMDAGFQELPAPLELLEKVYRMYRFTGDERWLSQTFMDYGKQLLNEFANRYDFNGNGIVDNRGNEGILPTLWEFEGASHIGDNELSFSLSPDEQGGSLVIDKGYFARLGVQDMSLKVRFRNGRDDYLRVRINNLTSATGEAPILSNDYLFIENTQPTQDLQLSFNRAPGVTLTTLTDGKAPLVPGSDYSVSGNQVVISKRYLDRIIGNSSYRYKFSFGFQFSDASQARLVVESGSHSYADAILSQHSVTLDWNNLQDVNLALDFSQTPTENRDLYRIENNMNRVVEAGDTLGVQYQAILAYEQMLRAKAQLVNDSQEAATLIAKADQYRASAQALLSDFQTRWYDASQMTYARAFDGYGNAIFGWGHENSFFMPMKDLLEPGAKADAYLSFIHDNSESLNEEAKTYLPEAFFNYGQNDRGWYWMQAGLKRFFADRSDDQVIKTYPEIAFTNVSNLVTHMMGFEPNVPQHSVSTLSRLPASLGHVQVANLPLGQSLMQTSDYHREIDSLLTLRHDGQRSTTLSRSTGSGEPLTWRAQFIGSYPSLYVDGQALTASQISINGVTLSYVDLDLNGGQSIMVSTSEDGTEPPVEPPVAWTPLTDLTPVSQQSDWGSINLNKSVDGNPLRVGGQQYDSGIGTHASGEIIYDLQGQYQGFTALVGVDDEVGSNGSVRFKVYLDNQLAFDSGVMTGSDAASALDLDVEGVSQLRLVIEDGGDGINSDHADWLQPRLTQKVTVPLTSLTPLSASTGWGNMQYDRSIEGNPLTLGGQTFATGIGTHSTSEIVYDLKGLYSDFEAKVGVDDETGSNGSVAFEIYLDGQLAYDSGTLLGSDSPHALAVDVSGAQQMRLVTTDGGDNINFDHADWAVPVLIQNGH
ncbi:NPCBM/NEW2 domain-containing protein [Shewanella insulae]|uniref:NPCBM/NEW2 domain-containing protein n=1 Tax=Shewanella insulae TaxID=2681496 RepID=UPI001EFD2438|nr:NPCBM/NEW2 domain-containing protein [Shewanella insulae]MCG9755806.1 NPCBM/NEW2 domain-containing protein [Shewanella insulae]